ncbi:unnamed protein product, partial [Adineta steineri]
SNATIFKADYGVERSVSIKYLQQLEPWIPTNYSFNQTYLPSNEDIKQTFKDFKYNQVIFCVDYFQASLYSQCHIYSYPYKSKYYHKITNNFPGGLFKYVNIVSLFDDRPFEHEFFLQIARSFPYMKKLTVDHHKAQTNKQCRKSKNENITIREYHHLTLLSLEAAHEDYLEEFLLDTKIYLSNGVNLLANYETLKKQADQHINSLNIKFQEKAVITNKMNEKIIACLQNNLSSTENNSRFISWCRNSFALRVIGTRQFLCDIKFGKPILLYENMYDIYKKIHTETAHGGRDKCLDSLLINYSWFNKDLLQIFLKNCSSCQKRKSILKPMLSKPIIALDYFTKFCWARALQHKESREVYHCVREIFFMFGPPRIFQSDNGREFTNELINSLQIDFPNMRIVHGRPRHPQTQGLIGRANAILTDALVFGQDIRTNSHYWESLHEAVLTNDVQMDDLVVDKIIPSVKNIICEQSHSTLISNKSYTNSDEIPVNLINGTKTALETTKTTSPS